MNCLLLALLPITFAQSNEDAEMVSRIEVSARLKDGTTMQGTVERTFEMDASFGRAILDPKKISNIRFGPPPTVVTTSDGTQLRGKLRMRSLTISNFEETQSFLLSEIKSLVVVQKAVTKPGELTNGRAANGMTYHVRVPKNFAEDAPRDAIVILHGSNMNSATYVQSIAKTWPKIAQRYILIGINGEQRSPRSSAKNPAFNYTYINFGGNSKYSGSVARESPIMVKEVVQQLRDELPIERVFVGGHSQGGFLTYSLIMNYPDTFDGAFPISGGLIVQAAPDAFDDQELIAQQKSRPIAIVHSQSDPVVGFSGAQTAVDEYSKFDYPLVRLFDHKTAAHRFIFLPVDDAIQWVEEMSRTKPADILPVITQRVKNSQWRDACELVARLSDIDGAEKFAAELKPLVKKIETEAEQQFAKLSPLVSANTNGDWIDDYLKFDNDFGRSDFACVKELKEKFDAIREQHQPAADKLYAAAKRDFQRKDRDAGYAKYQEVIEKYYASTWFPKMKRWLEERAAN